MAPSSVHHPPSHARLQGAARARRARAPSRTRLLPPLGAIGDVNPPPAPNLVPDAPYTKVVENGGVCTPRGFAAAGICAGLRASGSERRDVAVVAATTDEPATAAGVFTLNRVAAAPVQYDRAILDANDGVAPCRAVVINAGQANAATGSQGDEDTKACVQTAATALGCSDSEVLVMSTGVIGKRMKMENLLPGIPKVIHELAENDESGMNAAVAITTTDTVYKQAAVEVDLGEGFGTVRIGGTCKGSGMIHPNMATMLGVITCDAVVEPTLWRDMVRAACDASFNQVTVDGDTSTNDTVIALCHSVNTPGIGADGHVTTANSEQAVRLQAALTALAQGLSKSIAWDGEGATCLMQVNVSGASTDSDARTIARSVAASSLFKAAVFGRDPNWGRIACAAGYAGVEFDQSALRISLGPHALMEAGQPLEFDEKAASGYLKAAGDVRGTVVVDISVGSGQGSGVAFGCDLSYDYVEINAEYTT